MYIAEREIKGSG